MPSWSSRPSLQGWPCKAHCSTHQQKMFRRLDQSSSRRRRSRNRYWCSPPNQREGEGAQKSPKLRSKQPKRCKSLRRQSSLIIPCHLRQIFKPTLLPPKSRRASSRSASRVGIAIKAISSSLHHSRAWFAAEAPLTPTIFGSLSPAQWDAKLATSSRYHYVGPITGIITASATRPPGGVDRPSIPSGLRGSSGFQRVVSNEGDGFGSMARSEAKEGCDVEQFF